MASLDGFQGHFDMLYDDARNQAYAEAIRRFAAKRQGSKPLRALDIGSGSGLLGLLCWQTGRFEEVILVEACPPLAEAARENLKRNQAEKSCQVWEGHSDELLHQPTDLCAFDLCVSELLDSVLIGEGVLATLQKALASPLLLGTTMIPESATVWGRLFCSKALFQRHRGATEELPEEMRTCPGLHAAEHVHLWPFLHAGLMDFVSEPFEVFRFDFSQASTASARRRLAVRAERAAHGLALWFDARLGEGVSLTTAPAPEPREHWRQAALCFRHAVGPGTVEMDLHHDEDAIWVTLPGKAVEKAIAGRPPVCRCGLHAGTSRLRLGRPWRMAVAEGTGCALAVGDGPELPRLLRRRGYDPVVAVGRGLLNATLLQKLAPGVRVALKTGEVIGAGYGRKRRAPAMEESFQADSEEESDFDWPQLASELKDCAWQVFSEPWYEAVAEDWGFQHFVQFAHDVQALSNCGVSVDAGPCLRLKCAGFHSDWLSRRLRALPERCEGLDLRALNELHQGQRSVDVWPLRSAGLLRMSSDGIELGMLSWRQARLEVSAELVARPSHGILLWLEQEAGVDWYAALVSEDPTEMSELRHQRFGVVLFPELVEGDNLTLSLRLDFIRREYTVESRFSQIGT